MKTITLFAALFITFASLSAYGQAATEQDAIKRTALNYAEGWYEGDADKMESALSTDLAKRIVRTNPQGQSMVSQMTALALVQGTRGGFGKQTAKAEQQKDVTILDVMGNAATVKLEMHDWVDYMHIGKVNGKWVIINVLWEMKPKKAVEDSHETHARIAVICLVAFYRLPFGQADAFVKDDGVTNDLHRANVGRIVFTPKSDTTAEADFLKTFELKETGDLAIRAFMQTSLTNYLHRLAPEKSSDELNRDGNYQIAFYVDGALIHKEDLSPGSGPRRE
jgi:hypothetical protein